MLVLLIWLILSPLAWAGSAFNGTTSLLAITHSSAIGGSQLSVGCWFRRTGDGSSGLDVLVAKTSFSSDGWVLRDWPGGPFTLVHAGWTGGVGEWTIPRLSLNTWQHLLMVYNATTTAPPTVYLNGLLVTVTTNLTPSGSYQASTAALTIGNEAGQSMTFLGEAGECVYYDRLLSASEVRALSCRGAHCGARAVPRSVIGYWPLGVFGGRNYTTSSGLHGTLTSVSSVANGPPVSYASQGR